MASDRGEYQQQVDLEIGDLGEVEEKKASWASTFCTGTCSVGFFASLGAAGGAAASSTGAAILKAAGHIGYNVEKMATNGAIGGAITALPTLAIGILGYALKRCLTGQPPDARTSKGDVIGTAILCALSSAAAASLGAYIQGDDVLTNALAAGTGSLVLGAGSLALASCCS